MKYIILILHLSFHVALANEPAHGQCSIVAKTEGKEYSESTIETSNSKKHVIGYLHSSGDRSAIFQILKASEAGAKKMDLNGESLSPKEALIKALNFGKNSEISKQTLDIIKSIRIKIRNGEIEKVLTEYTVIQDIDSLKNDIHSTKIRLFAAGLNAEEVEDTLALIFGPARLIMNEFSPKISFARAENDIGLIQKSAASQRTFKGIANVFSQGANPLFKEVLSLGDKVNSDSLTNIDSIKDKLDALFNKIGSTTVDLKQGEQQQKIPLKDLVQSYIDSLVDFNKHREQRNKIMLDTTQKSGTNTLVLVGNTHALYILNSFRANCKGLKAGIPSEKESSATSSTR